MDKGWYRQQVATLTKNYDMVKHFSREERVQYYAAMHKFWESVYRKHPNTRNLGMYSRFKTLKEKEE